MGWDCRVNAILPRLAAQAMQEILGPFTDIPAPDINTDERHMVGGPASWMGRGFSRIGRIGRGFGRPNTRLEHGRNMGGKGANGAQH